MLADDDDAVHGVPVRSLDADHSLGFALNQNDVQKVMSEIRLLDLISLCHKRRPRADRIN